MILSNYYNIFANVADRIPNWRNMSKNTLLKECVVNENNKELKDAYVAAIMCKCWPAIYKYYASSRNSVNVEDCFEWLSHAVLYTIEHRKWLDPQSSMYNDPNGPDKILNRCIASTRDIFYQASNADNRKINYGLESIEGLEEDELSYVLPTVDSFEDNVTDDKLYIKHLVQKAFNTNHEIRAFVIDGIVNADVFKKDSDTNATLFNKRKLIKHLRNIDNDYCKVIADAYNININKIVEVSKDLKEISSIKLYKAVDQTLQYVKKDYENSMAM